MIFSRRRRIALLGALVMLSAACSPGGGQALESSPVDTVVVQEATSAPSPTPREAAAKESVGETTNENAAEAADDTLPVRIVRFTIIPEETIAGYSIQEVFLSDDNTLASAVGVTSAVQGGMALNYDDPVASEFQPFVVDISTLTSDRSRRDRAIRSKWLESATYPRATFEVAEVRGFPDNPEEGAHIAFQLAGEMTVKEKTRDVVWDVTATLDGDRLTGTASLDTLLADFDIPVPNIAGILRVTDGITLSLDFVMERVPG